MEYFLQQLLVHGVLNSQILEYWSTVWSRQKANSSDTYSHKLSIQKEKMENSSEIIYVIDK